jgi:hypothetical protein
VQHAKQFPSTNYKQSQITSKQPDLSLTRHKLLVHPQCTPLSQPHTKSSYANHTKLIIFINKNKKLNKTHHCLGLGIERSDEVGRVLLLEPDSRPERVTRIVLEDTPSGVVDQHQAFLSAHVGQGQSSDDIGPDGLDLVGLAPVHVGSAGDSGGVEDVGGLHGRQVGDERRAVLETAGAVREVYALGLAEPPKHAAYPAGAAVDQELERFVGGRRAICWETHQRERLRE